MAVDSGAPSGRYKNKHCYEDDEEHYYYKISVHIEDGNSMDLYLRSTGGIFVDKVPSVILRDQGIPAKDDIKTNIEMITKEEYTKFLEK